MPKEAMLVVTAKPDWRLGPLVGDVLYEYLLVGQGARMLKIRDGHGASAIAACDQGALKR